MSVQKGGIPGVLGCLEYTGLVTQLIRELCEGNEDLAVLWLDLASAYGSIPHKLVENTLDQHHIPCKIKVLILNYYGNFRLTVTSGSITSNWHRLEKGIITGLIFSSCSPWVCWWRQLRWSVEAPCPSLEFDSPPSVPLSTTWWLPLHQCLDAGGSFRACKNSSIELGWVLKRGKVVDNFRFSVDSVTIPSITEKPVPCLGKFFDCNLGDTVSVQADIKKLEA